MKKLKQKTYHDIEILETDELVSDAIEIRQNLNKVFIEVDCIKDFCKSIQVEQIEPVKNWSDVKQKYLEHLINNYDKGYIALLEWLEKNYSGINENQTISEPEYIPDFDLVLNVLQQVEITDSRSGNKVIKDIDDVVNSIINIFKYKQNTELTPKYQQCPECFNSDKNCNWCDGKGIIETN